MSLHGFLGPSLPLKAQYLQNVALRLPGTKPHLKGSTPLEPLQLALQQKLQQLVVTSANSRLACFRNVFPFVMTCHSKFLSIRNGFGITSKWPHGPLASLGAPGRPKSDFSAILEFIRVSIRDTKTNKHWIRIDARIQHHFISSSSAFLRPPGSLLAPILGSFWGACLRPEPERRISENR